MPIAYGTPHSLHVHLNMLFSEPAHYNLNATQCLLCGSCYSSLKETENAQIISLRANPLKQHDELNLAITWPFCLVWIVIVEGVHN